MRIVAITSCVTFGLLALNCVAEPLRRDGDAFVLPEIVVNAKRNSSTAAVLVSKAEVDDFEAWNSLTVADALMLTPGVNIQVGGSSGDARAWIRAFRDRDVLVLFDGIPIASPFEGTIDLNEIPIEAIAHTKVLKGAPSVIYGTNGIGGVVDLIPKEASDDLQLTADALIGSNSKRRYSGTFGAGGRGMKLFAAASVDEIDHYELSRDYSPSADQPSGKRLNSDYRRQNAFIRMRVPDWQLGDSAVFISYSNNERGLVPEVGDADYERLTQADRTTIGISTALRQLPVSFKLFRNDTSSEITVYETSDYTTVEEIEYGEDSATGAMAYATLDVTENSALILSTMYVQDEYRATGVFDNTNTVKVETYTLAAEHQWVSGGRWTVATGGIFNRFHQPIVDKTLSVFNPQIAVGFEVTERWALHASAAQRTRLPKLRELYRRRYGNPELNEQEAKNYDAGVKYQNGSGLVADLTLFHSDIDGLIERFDRSSLYENLQDVRIQGFEASLAAQLNPSVYLRVSALLADAEQRGLEVSDQQMRSRPRQTFTADLRFQLPAEYTLSVNAMHVRGLYDRDQQDDLIRLPSYSVFNATLQKEFANKFSARLSVSNLTDENYQQRLGFPREGRSLVAGVSYALGY